MFSETLKLKTATTQSCVIIHSAALRLAAVIKATLVELFSTREQAQAITVWHDPRQQAPTLSAFGGPWDHHDTLALQVVDTTGLDLPFRV